MRATSIAIGVAAFFVIAALSFFPFDWVFDRDAGFIDRSIISDNREPPAEETVLEEKPDVSAPEIQEEEKSEQQKNKTPVKPTEQKSSSRAPMAVVVPSSPVPLPATTTTDATPPVVTQEKQKLPTIDEDAIFRAVVKIQCPAADGIGKFIGSGFLVKGGIVVTASHIIMDSGANTCDVIFSKDRFPVHYLKGEITEDVSVIRKRFEDRGIDIGFLKLPAIADYAEARVIFGNSYPAIPYPVCDSPSIIGDAIYHYGYPSNFKDLNYLSRMEGVVVSYADIEGTRVHTPADGGAPYRAPDFSFIVDDGEFHSYAVSKVGIFYGSSGGPAFDASKACVLGVNHGFGQGSTEAYSVFLTLGWGETRTLLP